MAHRRTTLFLVLLAALGPAHARWAPVERPTDADLNGVCLLPDGAGWAVGDGGTVVATTDGGETWTPQSLLLKFRLTSVSFATPQVGWVSGDGGEAARTTSGGEAWSAVTVVRDDLGLGPPDTVTPLIATGELSAWALARWGDATFLYHTADGGETWDTVRYTDRGYNSPGTIFGMAFSSDTEGWLLAARITGPPQAYIPVFLYTTDGGAHWQALDAYATPLSQPSTPDWSAALGAASATNVLAHVWDSDRAAGSVFHVVKDPQDLWRQVAVPLDAPISSVSFPSAANAWLVGAATHQSVDFGHTFRRAENPEALPLAASFAGDNAGIAVGPGGRVYRWEPDPPGDVNGDGRVDLADAVLSASMLAGEPPGDALSRRMADVDPAPDGDGEITAADTAGILGQAGGLE